MDESMDTSVDTSADTAPDTSVDTAPDTSDTGSDTAADTSDAGFDAPEDVPEDVLEDTPDVSFDAPEDVPEDIPEDVPEDEPEEVYADTSEDVPEDVPEDGPDWDAEEEEGPELVLKRDEMELLNSGNAAIEQRLEAQADEYRDQGLSESEIASRLESDRRDFQQEFLQDAFPGQDVSPDVFNGFSNPDVSGLARYPEGEGPADMAAPDVPDAPEAPGSDWQDTAGDVPVTGFDSADTPADVPEDVPEDIPEDIPEAAPGDVPEGFFDGLEQDTPEDIPEDVPEDVPEDTPEAAPGDVPEGFFDGLEQDAPEDIPEDVPEDTPVDMPEAAPGDVPEADDGFYHAVPNAELVGSSGGADGEDADLLETDGGADAAEHADSDVPISADVRTVDDVNGWLGDINPNYDAFDPESPYCSNCGSCAYAVYQRLEGSTDSCASAENIGYNKDMEALTGMKQVPMSPSEIEQRLLDQGDGAHAIIGIDRAEGPGHWFNAACIDGKVVAIDGQSGEIMDWPPDYGNVVNWEMSIKQ